MSFNKYLLRFTNGYSKLPLLQISYNSTRSNSSFIVKRPNIFRRNLSKEVSLKHSRLPPKQVSFCWYSSAANEEQMKTKDPTSISVPTLQFENVTFEQPITHDDLCKALQICKSVEEQMFTLTSELALSSDDVQKRIKFCKVIESLLKPFFGVFKIQMFGSTVNGFGFKGCDIDMSFETSTEKKEEIPYLEVPDVPLVSEVICGKISPAEICLLPPKEQLLFIHSVLLEFYKESEDPIIFINAHVPLVRFYHDKYGLKCDLTCRNRVAFSNTKLLYLLGRLDERVIPMMMTIRYWAKHVEIIGRGLMFNTYTISLLVIHFLQTRNPPILPSAEHILSLSDRLQIEDMSDKSFLAVKKFIPPSENKQTLNELLKDFFFYYLYFDFTRVICPLIGGSVSRDEFFSASTSKKFRMNTICVQDPMLISHNVAELVDYKHCKKLFTELIAACRIFQNSSHLSPSSSNWGLLSLLDKSEEYIACNQMLQKNFSLTVPLITKQVFKNNIKGDKKLVTAETLLQLLEHILLFECNPLDIPDVIKMLKIHDEAIEKQKKQTEVLIQLNSNVLEVYQKYKKGKTTNLNLQKFSDALMLEEFQKFNLRNKLILCAKCKAVKNTWLGRNHVSLQNLPASNFIEKEHYISIHAAKQNEINAMDGKMKPFTFFYECYVSPESELLVNFRTFQKTSFNPILEIFLKEYLPYLIKTLNNN